MLAGRLMQDLQMLAPDELWIPMGLGDHIDHRTTRNACVMMLAEARTRFPNIPVVMYEEVPYAAYVDHAAQIRAVFGNSGTRLIRAAEDITDVFGEKLRVISVYASQFKGSYMEPGIRKCAQRDSEGRFAEVYHRVEGEPHLPPCDGDRIAVRPLGEMEDRPGVVGDGISQRRSQGLPARKLGLAG